MKLRLMIILILNLVCFSTSYTQNKADSLFAQSRLLKSEKKIDSSLNISIEAIKVYHENENWVGANDVLWHITKLKFSEARMAIFSDFITKQSALLQSSFPIEAAQLQSNIGMWFVRHGYYGKALPVFQKTAEDLNALNDTLYLHQVYFRLGQTVQLSRSDGAQAIVYANQAARVYALKNNQDSSFLGKVQYLKGRGYQTSDYVKAIKCFRNAQELNTRLLAECEIEIAKAFFRHRKFEEAHASAKKASEISFSQFGELNESYLIYEALILSALDRYNEAISKLDESLKISANYYSKSDPEYIKIFYYKAQVFKKNSQYDLALENIQKVYSSFYSEYEAKFNSDIPDISQETPDHWVLDALEEQGNILVRKFQDSKDSKFLELAITAYNKALNDLEVRRKEMDNWDSKEQYNQILYDIYEHTLIASAWLYQSKPTLENKNLVLSILEKSKATLLQESLEIKKDKENIPTEILNQENEILKSITDLETKILKEQKGGNSSNSKTLENKLFDTKQKLDNFKKKNSVYYTNSTTSDSSLSHDQIVNNLPEGTAVISYHIGEEEVLSLGFNKDNLHITFTPKSNKFDESVLKMRQTLSDWNSTLSNRAASEDSISMSAKHISNILLSPLADFSTQPKQLIIMPNGALHNIPFELLPIPEDDQVMIEKYDISYAYLFSSFPNSEESNTRSLSFAGFAPKYNKDKESIASDIKEETIEDSKLLALRSGLIDIPEARKSVSALASKYNGSSWINDLATKENFIKEAKNYDVLHLGMHSLLNENTSSLSSLVFSGETDNELYLREIRSMDIPASLVVLSACNTGVGRNVVGEGPFSLARAFFYAGAESALMSLWQVPDVQTSRMMQLFYSNLESGLDKSAALSQAKRDYLKTASVLESHPAFWSGFVLVGDSAAIGLESKQAFLSSYYKYLLIALFIGVLLWLFLRKVRSK